MFLKNQKKLRKKAKNINFKSLKYHGNNCIPCVRDFGHNHWDFDFDLAEVDQDRPRSLLHHSRDFGPNRGDDIEQKRAEKDAILKSFLQFS